MKKTNNKILIGVLIILVGTFALSKLFRSARLTGNIKAQLVRIDTASVTKIHIYPHSENGKEIQLLRKNKKWNVNTTNQQASVDQGAVSNLLGTLVEIKPIRLVTTKKEKWSEYQVAETDTRVKVYKNDGLQADLFIGKIGYNQGSGNQIGAGVFTYARLADSDEVYAVEGYLESVYNKKFDDWRDKSFLRLRKDLITELQFNYAEDSSFVLSKKDKLWMIGGQVADSTKVISYLAQLESKNASAFADDFSNANAADAQVIIKGAASSIATVSGWRRTQDWVMQSSWQPGIFFSSENNGLAKSIFQSQKDFLQPKKE